jgi:hypothetical protein
VAENRREEQKLWLILFQIKAIRTRLNLLAVQYWLFVTIAILGGAAGLIFLAAIALSPLLFLAISALVCVFGAAALVRVAGTALRQGANRKHAAALADRRAELKGRLTTVLALADAAASPLWPYLVEDTYTLRHRFEPATVEPRWVSRSIIAPLAVIAILCGLLLLSKHYRTKLATETGAPAELTADLGNLEIRPADPSLPANARVYADPATLRQLAAKLAQAQKEANDHSGVARWMNKARQLAGTLQDQVSGKQPLALPPLTLRLRSTPPAPDSNDSGPSPEAGDRSGQNPEDAPINPPGTPNSGNAAAGDQQPPATNPPEDEDQLAQNSPPSSPADSSTGIPEDQSGPKVGSGYTGAAGSSHSAGTDPEHLFGPPAPNPVGSDSFKLSIDARPVDEASSGGGPAYLPPKVHVALNSHQFPDEPLVRASVPLDDRETIKRVFER